MQYIRRLTGYALRYKALFFGFLACAGIGTLFNILSPIVLANIIDVVIYQGQYDQLASSVAIYIALMALYALFDIAGRYGAAITSQKVIYDLRKELYDSLMEKDLSFYDQEETGQLLSRVTTDVNQMKQFLFWGYRVIFIGFATIVGVYFVMYTLSVSLTLFMLLLLPIIISFVYVFARKVRPVFIAARDKFGELSSVLSENIVGMKVVKSYAAGERESDRVREENQKFLDLRVEAFKLFAFYRPLLPTLFGVVTGILIYIGGFYFILGELSYGVFVGFVTLVGMLMLPARFLSWGVGMFQRASAAGERSFYILDHKDEVLNPENPIMKKAKGKIEFDDVYFSYGRDTYILKGVSLKADPGNVVALLGGTGSGKTTLMNLIPRFYDADTERNVTYDGETYKVVGDTVEIGDQEHEVHNGAATIEGEQVEVVEPGRLYIDGIDVRKYDLDMLRSSIGMVHQDPFLFSATIRENIAFARPNAPLDEVIDAAKAAMIHDFIETLDEGYDAPVGERGVTLSGGQKQRIAIARALLANPKILILDDSTSSVDANTEMKIQKALENLMVGRTTFIITHRLSTVRNADLIVMLERGKVVEKGTHEELMKEGGLYAGIHDTLFEMELAASAIEGSASDE
jgi:ATP-binding cassette subfamily B protein